jgi:hypothetical protein
MRRLTLILLVLCLAIIPCGCGKKTLKTEGVSGVITLDGQPLANATIHFIPADAEGSHSYGNTNESGEYKLQTLLGDADAGTTPGKYKIRIDCIEMYETGKTFEESGEEKPEMLSRSIIPAKYNDENTSGLEATVVKGANTFNFDLEK